MKRIMTISEVLEYLFKFLCDDAERHLQYLRRVYTHPFKK